MLRDIRYGIRSLALRPGFSLLVILTLALGIGVNTAIFTIINGVLLKPLPGVRTTERLVEITRDVNGRFFDVPYPVFIDLRNSEALEDLAAFSFIQAALTTDGAPFVVGGFSVTWNYFELIGTRPARGRLFTRDEAFFPRVENVAIISHDLWHARFASRADILGSRVSINGLPVEIIGVAEPGFGGHAAGLKGDLWIPIGLPAPGLHGAEALSRRDSHIIETLGRLTVGTSVASARDALTALADRQDRAHDASARPGQFRIRVAPYAPIPGVIRSGITLFLAVMAIFVILVMSIACTNVAGMLLTRGAERAREIAIRLSLGASRRRLVRQLLVESQMLFVAAAGVGVLMALWLSRLLMAFEPPIPLPGVRLDLNVGLDHRVLGFSLLLSLGTGVVFGLFPALRATKPGLMPELVDGGSAGTPYRSRLRFLMGAVQMAVTLMLLISSGLFIRSLHASRALDAGFDPSNVNVAAFDLELSAFTPDAARGFFEDLLERVRSVPGVETAATARKLPLAGRSSYGYVTVEGIRPPDGRGGFETSHNIVSTNYFRTLRIPIESGRSFEASDAPGTVPVAVLNRTLASRIWPEGEAVGRRFQYNGKEFTVIGIAADASYHQLGEGRTPFLYLHHRQIPSQEMTLHVRTAAGHPLTAAMMSALVKEMNPGVPILSFLSLDDALQVHFLPQRLAAWVTGIVGLLGLGLAGVGIYGATAYATTRRSHEVGVRIALGATPAAIVRLIVGQGMKAPLVGVLVGLTGAAILTRFLSFLLMGVDPVDPFTFGTVLIVILAAAMAANLLPARRLARLDPVRTLRKD